MIIEKLQEKNIKEFCDLAQRIILDLSYYSDIAKKNYAKSFEVKEIQNKIKNENKLFLSAKNNNKIVGFMYGFFDNTGLFWIEWIGINEENRRKGIGNEILKFLINYLKESKKVHKIVCDIRTSNLPSQKFFAKNKFNKIALLKNFWHKEDFEIWELTL
ncbi:MAG: GNAT family N-acetyltransferase [Patescibacteria group bacterium]|jgi:RimJ/RimL family protein N-acetyltransferase